MWCPASKHLESELKKLNTGIGNGLQMFFALASSFCTSVF